MSLYLILFSLFGSPSAETTELRRVVPIEVHEPSRGPVLLERPRRVRREPQVRTSNRSLEKSAQKTRVQRKRRPASLHSQELKRKKLKKRSKPRRAWTGSKK